MESRCLTVQVGRKPVESVKLPIRMALFLVTYGLVLLSNVQMRVMASSGHQIGAELRKKGGHRTCALPVYLTYL
jgi:hypothetical protein